MAQIGTFGDADVPIFQEKSVDDPFFYMYCPQADEWGVLNMVPLDDVPQDEYPVVYHHRSKDGVEYGSRRTADVIIDDYEDANLNEYRNAGQNDDTGSATTNASQAISGNYSLRMSQFQRVWSQPGDGLPSYPRWGDTLQFTIKWSSVDVGTRVYYGMQGNNPPKELYELWMYGDGALRLVRRDSNGYRHQIDTRNDLNINTGHEYLVQIAWRSDDYNADHHVLVKDTDGPGSWTLSGNDTAHRNGGFGFRCDEGNTVFIDDVMLVNR